MKKSIVSVFTLALLLSFSSISNGKDVQVIQSEDWFGASVFTKYYENDCTVIMQESCSGIWGFC